MGDAECRSSATSRQVNGLKSKRNGLVDHTDSGGNEKASCAHENAQNGRSLNIAGDRCENNSSSSQQQQQQSCAANVKTPSAKDRDLIDSIAYALSTDIVNYVSFKGLPTQPKPCGVHATTLRRTVDQVSERHEILFTSIAKKIHIGEDGTNCDSFVSVADEMFADKHYNWGRVVTLYAFAGWLAKYCVEHRIEGDWVDMIGKACGKYVVEHLGEWIASQGGWDAMVKFFPEQEDVESKIWRGLFYTMIGLGALATTVAAVR